MSNPVCRCGHFKTLHSLSDPQGCIAEQVRDDVCPCTGFVEAAPPPQQEEEPKTADQWMQVFEDEWGIDLPDLDKKQRQSFMSIIQRIQAQAEKRGKAEAWEEGYAQGTYDCERDRLNSERTNPYTDA